MTTTLVISGGTVHDGSGGPGRVADVLVDGDRITAVSPGAGAVGPDVPVLDATGLVVAPGFVNVLSHAYFTLEQDGRGLSDLYQGVTTQIFGEGTSIGPHTPEVRAELEAGNGPDDPPLVWDRLSEFLAHLEGKGVAQNVASFVGAHNLRMIGAGSDDRPMTAAELSRVRGVLDEEMADGALGVGSALIYPPGCFASTDELVALCEVVARYGGSYISHLRSEGDHFLDAVDELITIGRRAGVHAEIYHLKAAGRHNWPKMARAVERVEAARSAGQPVTADIYPYLAGQTQLGASIPPHFHEGGHEALATRLADPGERTRIREGVTTPSERWENLFLAAGGADGVMLLPDPNGPHGGVSRPQPAAGGRPGRDRAGGDAAAAGRAGADPARHVLHDERGGAAHRAAQPVGLRRVRRADLRHRGAVRRRAHASSGLWDVRPHPRQVRARAVPADPRRGGTPDDQSAAWESRAAGSRPARAGQVRRHRGVRPGDGGRPRDVRGAAPVRHRGPARGGQRTAACSRTAYPPEIFPAAPSGVDADDPRPRYCYGVGVTLRKGIHAGSTAITPGRSAGPRDGFRRMRCGSCSSD